MEIQLLIALVAALFSVLTALIGWLGARMLTKMDALVESNQDLHLRINNSHSEVQTLISDKHNEVHVRINGIDRRVTILEAKT